MKKTLFNITSIDIFYFQFNKKITFLIKIFNSIDFVFHFINGIYKYLIFNSCHLCLLEKKVNINNL